MRSAASWLTSKIDHVDHAVGGVDIRQHDPGPVDPGRAVVQRRHEEALRERPDPAAVEDRGRVAIAWRDVVQQDRLQGVDRDLVDPADAERREEPLERGVGRGEDGELAMAVQGVDQAGPDDCGDELIELAGPGVDRDGGLDDRRALAGGDGLGAEAEERAAVAAEEQDVAWVRAPMMGQVSPTLRQ